MYVRWFIVVLFVTQGKSECVKNKIKLWSPTKCEAGRSFFARLSSIANFSGQGIAQPYLYPWLAELKIAPPGRIKSCTGALINDRYVLTAQSCVYPPVQPQDIAVHVGFYNGYDKDLSEIFQPRILERRVTNIILFPQYDPGNPQTAANNLGLVRLDIPVKYSKTIYPIQLPTAGDKFTNYGNKLAENMEWSFFPNDGTPNYKKLKESAVKILDAEECSRFNNNYQQIVTPGLICSVNVGNNTKPCGDEHGGLLTLDRRQRLYNITVLVGITAWEPTTSTCQNFGPPRAYVRIDNQLLWIKANTRDGLYCRY